MARMSHGTTMNSYRNDGGRLAIRLCCANPAGARYLQNMDEVEDGLAIAVCFAGVLCRATCCPVLASGHQQTALGLFHYVQPYPYHYTTPGDI